MLELAVEKVRSGGVLPQPEALMAAWNSRYPERAYHDRWRFRNHYAEAVQQILKPGQMTREKR